MKIAITGAGAVSAIGLGKTEILASLLEGRSGIGPVRYLTTSHPEFPVGEVPLSNSEMRERLSLEDDRPYTRTALLGAMALREALSEAGLDPSDLSDVPMISGTTVGGMDRSEEYYKDFISPDSRSYSEYIKVHDCGATTALTGEICGNFAFSTTLSTACSSAANAIILGANLLRSGRAEKVAVGGSECLSDFHLSGFNTLMILDRERCKPFDSRRAGLNLGEGAGYLILETEESALRRGAKPLAYLSGFGNACDAFHQTASSPDGEGAFLAMSKAIAMGGLEPSEVDYVNAHGTGTPNNDASETAAMKRVFGDSMPSVSSTKSLTGHTTSATGGLESVICLLALANGFIPANIGWESPDADCIRPVSEVRRGVRLSNILCNSFGFGGNDSSLLFTREGRDIACHDSDNGIFVKAVSRITPETGDPDFKKFISPIEARRMGKLMKRALATSMTVLEEAGVANPDAIITGTKYGSVEYTEALLFSLKGLSDQPMKPTFFMQSTHNTVGSLIGIRTASHGYNATYSHGDESFDGALLDAELQLRLGEIDNALVGVFDETTPIFSAMLAKAGIPSTDIALSVFLDHKPEGALCRLEELNEYLKTTI